MTYPTQKFVADADGELVTIINGKVSSKNRDLVKQVERADLLHTPVQLIIPHGPYYYADLSDPFNNPMGVAAAILSAAPGRTRLLDAPGSVLAQIDLDWQNFGEVNLHPELDGNTTAEHFEDPDENN